MQQVLKQLSLRSRVYRLNGQNKMINYLSQVYPAMNNYNRKLSYKILLLCAFLIAIPSYALSQNNALTFDGTDDYVSFTTSPSYLTTFTIEAWIKTTNDADVNDIVCWGNTSTSDNVQFRTSHGKLSFGSDPDGADPWMSCISSAFVNTGTWTHVAVVKDGESVQLYVNGIADGSGTNSYPMNVNYMLIGKYVNDPFYFSGSMDEVRIWDTARTATQIRQNMYQELSDPSSETNLVTYYKCDETSGTTLTDSKGSYNGILNNYGSQSDYWQTSSATPGSKNCLDFDGSDDYVALPSSLYTDNLNEGTAITIEYWFKGTSLESPVRFQNGEYIVAGWGDPSQFIISSDGGTEGVTIGTSEEIEDGNWHHIACVWEANTTDGFRTYLDGVLKNKRTSADVTLPAISSGARLGAYENNECLAGSLDEVRIWNTARTDTQIREDMMRSLNGDEGGLIAYYHLNETSGTIAHDATAHGYNGTLTNMDESSDWLNSGAFTTWLGGTSNDWSTASNWTDGIPTSTDNVGIYKLNANNEVTISGTPEVKNLIISSTSSPTLSSGITVNGNLFLEKNMDLNGQIVTLGSSATLVEDAGVFSGTSGAITTTRSLSNINEDVAGLGAVITTSADMGNTTITRTHTSVNGNNFNSSVLRQYSIAPTINTGLNATLKFNYLNSELNGLKESTFQLVKSTDNGLTWNEQGGDVSTDNNTITLTGIDAFGSWGVTQLIQPMNNNALYFDGTDDYINFDSSPLYSEAITIEAWIKTTNDADVNDIVCWGNLSRSDNVQFRTSHGKFSFGSHPYGGEWISVSSSADVNTGEWTHVAVVKNGESVQLYVNGVADGSGINPNSMSVNYMFIGRYVNDANYFSGSMDEVRIWNTARTATQIRENMMRTLDGDESGLVAYYHLNETGGTRAYDATANNYVGTVNNATWTDSQAFTTWLGGINSDWATASNWTDGVPTSSSNIGIYKWTGNNEASINGTPEVKNLVISSTSSPTLSSGITVNGSLVLEKNMDLSGQTVSLGNSATLVEDAGAFSGTNGTITTTRNLSNINENVAGLGAVITTSADMGETTITRSHASLGVNKILRQYGISPTNNSGLNASLTFNYRDSELNGIQESKLSLFKSSNGGTTWINQGGTLDANANTITLNSIDGFSLWTASYNNDIPTASKEISESSIQVYPNPCTNSIHLRNVSDDISKITITDISGRIFLTADYKKEKEIKVNNLLPGVYLLTLETENGDTSAIRFLKN